MTDKHIDLHTHSTKSDGTLTPAELARAAKDAGLCAIALTDHDTVDGAEEFCEECSRLCIEGIPGVEIGAKFHRELHIVGLYIGGDDFLKTISLLRDSRRERNIKMLAKLRELGFDITEKDITRDRGVTISSAGRAHMAIALVRNGYMPDMQTAFDTLLAKGKSAYISRFALSPEDCVRLIKDCGGAAVWAHPIYAAESEDELTDIALRLKSAGLDAMECLYSRYDKDETELCKKTARRAGLLISGGSDFHGKNKPDVELGKVCGGYVPYEVLKAIKEKIGLFK